MENTNEFSVVLVKTILTKTGEKFADIYKCGNLYCAVKNGDVVEHNFDLQQLEESVKEKRKEWEGEEE